MATIAYSDDESPCHSVHATHVPAASFWTTVHESLEDAIHTNIPSFEYEMLSEELMTKTKFDKFSAGRNIVNQAKNRYSNILPYDHTRVKLTAREEDEGSDYINASFLGPKQEFIASQAPTPDTFSDFWRMIYQYRVPVIVVLTKEREGNKIKSHRYWPDLGDKETYDEVTVELVLEENEQDMTIRHFFVQVDGQTGLSVIQFQFTAWPDHGVPEETGSLHRLIRQVEGTNPSPLLVHCSAGVGRTGAFILAIQKIRELQWYSEQMDENGLCEVPAVGMMDLLRDLRSQRHGMCQTKSQYRFCYLLLEEMILKYYINN